MIAENLRQVSARIASACQRVGRAAQSVQLVAISKLKPSTLIREAYQAGQLDFGENYAQEMRDKAVELADLKSVRWHAVGPLQLNKAKYVARMAYAFHALDRKEIGEELSRRRQGPPLQCFLEVNLAKEASKSGVAEKGAERLLDELRSLPNLIVVGLMCLPPLSSTPEGSRGYFRALAILGKQLGLSQLSMGTTHDFEVAIEEGATVVRVGTAIFGERLPLSQLERPFD